MGFVSNQWLNRGMGLRKRSYHPVPVSIECEEARDSWSRQNEVVIGLFARKTGGEYHSLYLSQAEVDKAAVTLVARMTERKREALLDQLLRDLSNESLLKALLADLKKRVAR
jgi:hypothetical protein